MKKYELVDCLIKNNRITLYNTNSCAVDNYIQLLNIVNGFINDKLDII